MTQPTQPTAQPGQPTTSIPATTAPGHIANTSMQPQGLPMPTGYPVEPRNGPGFAALVLGVLGLITWVIPLVGFPVTMIALSCGFRGRDRAKRGQATNGGQAKAGIILAIIAIPLIVANSVSGAILAVMHH